MKQHAPTNTRRPPARIFGARSADEITIDAPADHVWRIYTDIERWPQWTASVTSATIDSAGPLAVGDHVRIKQPRLPAVAWTVTELQPGTHWTWTNKAPGARTAAGHRVTAIDAGRTHVTLWIDQRGVLGRPLGWVLRHLTHRYLRMEAEGLRRQSENHPPT